jgi:hypothetical protein
VNKKTVLVICTGRNENVICTGRNEKKNIRKNGIVIKKTKKKLMIYNSTNNNKTNNLLLSPLTSSYLLLPPLSEHKIKLPHMMLKIQVLAWDRHKNVAE